mmetsp:Transcript_37108/g.66408  ORF Transcript_37108/g.66408 Transcript_37108/m.66408 type:complete len:254 (-) Transcript_37108:442-1203(-)
MQNMALPVLQCRPFGANLRTAETRFLQLSILPFGRVQSSRCVNEPFTPLLYMLPLCTTNHCSHPRVLQHLRCGWASHGTPFEQNTNEILCLPGHTTPRLLSKVNGRHSYLGLIGEGHIPTQHLIQDDAQRPHIARITVLSTHKHLHSRQGRESERWKGKAGGEMTTTRATSQGWASLRCDVANGADELTKEDSIRLPLPARQSKVKHPDRASCGASLPHHILWFQVPMQDAQSVQSGHRLHQLPHHQSRHSFP